ncbi:MAG: hypothetical protein KKA81_13515 [Bacteroidetes bacterium]|nr:hypothetical protein [Bacteroidota bacterium]
MKRTRFLVLTTFFVFLFFTALAQDSIHPEDLLPSEELLGSFLLVQEVEKYSGDELFSLINGGADLFLEYGFSNVIKADYKNDEGSLSVEIYEMTDPQAAFGIYTMMQMKDDVPDNLGDAGQILGDYALFSKDRFVVKLNTNLPDKEAENILNKFSAGIAGKIKMSTFKPLMVIQLLPITHSDYPEMKIFKGPVGLNNIYPLSQSNIYNFKIGVAGIYENYKVLVLECTNVANAQIQYGAIADMIATTGKYSNFVQKGIDFSASDHINNKIAVSVYEKYVFLIIHTGNMNVEPLRREIRLNIDLISN